MARGIKPLEEAYPEDIDPTLANKLPHFHLYMRQTQIQGLTEEQCISMSYGDLIKLFAR